MIEIPDPTKGTDEEKIAWLLRELSRDYRIQIYAIRVAFGRYAYPGIDVRYRGRVGFLPYVKF
jgi:hypothetical protein